MTTHPATNSVSTPVGTYVKLVPVDELNKLSLEFKHNNQTYKITWVKQQVGLNGEEQEIDLSYFTDLENVPMEEKIQRQKELETIVDQAKKLIDLMPQISKKISQFHSISLTITQKQNALPVLETIQYREQAGTEEKKFTVNLSNRSPDEQNTIHQATMIFHQHLHQFIAHTKTPPKVNENLKPSPAPKQNPPPSGNTTNNPVDEIKDINLDITSSDHDDSSTNGTIYFSDNNESVSSTVEELPSDIEIALNNIKKNSKKNNNNSDSD